MIQKGVHVEAARGERGRPPAPSRFAKATQDKPWSATEWVAGDRSRYEVREQRRRSDEVSGD